MGNTLTGTTVAAGYDSILKTTDNGPLTSTLKTITDGLGNESVVKLSTDTFAAQNISFDSGTTKLICKVVEIGDWDMDTTGSVTIAHGITNGMAYIRVVDVLIRNDTPTIAWSLRTGSGGSSSAAGYFSHNDTSFSLVRFASGAFDGPTYSATSYNRGWITIWYVAS